MVEFRPAKVEKLYPPHFLPVWFSLSGKEPIMTGNRYLGALVLIIDDRHQVVPEVQAILTDYGDIIIGRMGIPRRPVGHCVITVAVEGGPVLIDNLIKALKAIKGVQVGATVVELED
ncbi:MAG TPA: hypothetical protein GXX29_03945 [Firmicutes bacterium]|nr:hypothetical protein [Bacillota bacterium]